MEQNINIRALSKKIKLVITGVFLVFLMSACMPMGDETVNTELFKSKDDLKVRAAQLKPGMKEKAVFKKLKIAKENFSFMSTQEVQMCVYGNSMIRGDTAELEKFKKKMMGYKGYFLPYRYIKSNGSLGFGTMKVKKKGHDLNLVLVFEKGKLLKADVNGNQNVNLKQDQFMWNTILRKSTGIGF